ncbi:MAG: WD40 repeat domain-containing protein, partial [Ruminococcus sp.]|nr:WD40 repeat domain-containing protein [Ruminococcus sp.]
MKVYEMQCSINGKYLIAGEFEMQIQIWNTERNEKICDIQTHFLFGGKRLTVSNSGKYFSAV